MAIFEVVDERLAARPGRTSVGRCCVAGEMVGKEGVEGVNEVSAKVSHPSNSTFVVDTVEHEYLYVSSL